MVDMYPGLVPGERESGGECRAESAEVVGWLCDLGGVMVRGFEGWEEGEGGCVVLLVVEVVVEGCFVGWKEERARKAARKLDRKGRGGCWAGEGILGGEASLEGAIVLGRCEAGMGMCGGGCAWFVVRGRGFPLYHKKEGRGFLLCQTRSTSRSFRSSAVSVGVSGGKLVDVGGFYTSALNTDLQSFSFVVEASYAISSPHGD